jgi:hypothetical protein
MEVIHSFERRLTFNGLHGVISQKTELFKTNDACKVESSGLAASCSCYSVQLPHSCAPLAEWQHATDRSVFEIRRGLLEVSAVEWVNLNVCSHRGAIGCNPICLSDSNSELISILKEAKTSYWRTRDMVHIAFVAVLELVGSRILHALRIV